MIASIHIELDDGSDMILRYDEEANQFVLSTYAETGHSQVVMSPLEFRAMCIDFVSALDIPNERPVAGP